MALVTRNRTEQCITSAALPANVTDDTFWEVVGIVPGRDAGTAVAAATACAGTYAGDSVCGLELYELRANGGALVSQLWFNWTNPLPNTTVYYFNGTEADVVNTTGLRGGMYFQPVQLTYAGGDALLAVYTLLAGPKFYQWCYQLNVYNVTQGFELVFATLMFPILEDPPISVVSAGVGRVVPHPHGWLVIDTYFTAWQAFVEVHGLAPDSESCVSVDFPTHMSLLMYLDGTGRLLAYACLEFSGSVSVQEVNGTSSVVTVAGETGWKGQQNRNALARYWLHASDGQASFAKIYEGEYHVGEYLCSLSLIQPFESATMLVGESNWNQVSTGSITRYFKTFVTLADLSGPAWNESTLTTFQLDLSERADRPWQIIPLEAPHNATADNATASPRALLVLSTNGPITHSADGGNALMVALLTFAPGHFPDPEPQKKQTQKTVLAIGLGAAAAVLALGILAAVVLVRRQQRRRQYVPLGS